MAAGSNIATDAPARRRASDSNDDACVMVMVLPCLFFIAAVERAPSRSAAQERSAVLCCRGRGPLLLPTSMRPALRFAACGLRGFRSPDGGAPALARRNTGSVVPWARVVPDYASLHPGYKVCIRIALLARCASR